LQEASTEKKKKCFLFQNTSPVRQKLSGKKPPSIPPLEGTKIRSPDRRRSYQAFYRLIQLTRKKQHTRTHNLGKISATKKQNLTITKRGNKQTTKQNKAKMESSKRLQIRRVRTRTHSHLQKETSRSPSLSSHLRLLLLLLLLRPETLQRHKLKEKQVKAKDTAKCKRWIRRETGEGFAVEQTTTKPTKALLLSAPGIELVMERRARQMIFLSK
jgi:hypothetical protein